MISRGALGALLSEHLSARGCPVVSPADPNVPDSFERSAEFGRLLARFHTAAQDFAAPAGSEWARLSRATLMGGDPGWIERTYSHDVQACATLVDWWSATDAILSVHVTMDRGICHGEAYPATCRITAAGLALAEFDWAGEGHRVYDLATFRWALALRSGHEAGESFARFLDGYSAVREPADLDVLRAWVAVRHLWSLRLAAGFAGVDELDDRASFAATWTID